MLSSGFTWVLYARPCPGWEQWLPEVRFWLVARQSQGDNQTWEKVQTTAPSEAIASHIIPHETTTYHFSTLGSFCKLNKGDATCKLLSFRGAACGAVFFRRLQTEPEELFPSFFFSFFKSGGATARSKQVLEVQCSWRSVVWDVT